MTPPLFIHKIWQKNNYLFCIQWNDGAIQDFRLSDLQKQCPCAQCTDEITGKLLLDLTGIPIDLKAISIRSVGRYGLRIQFSSGCSMGIYSFERLKNMKPGVSC